MILTVYDHLLVMKPPLQLCVLCTVYDWWHVYIVNEHCPYLLQDFRVLMTRWSISQRCKYRLLWFTNNLTINKTIFKWTSTVQTNVQYNHHIPTKLQLSP